MWTPQNRKRYDRNRLRYPSDLTDEEWAHVAPVIPPAKPGGNKRTVGVREVMNGVMYVLSTGCQWRHLLSGVCHRCLPQPSLRQTYIVFCRRYTVCPRCPARGERHLFAIDALATCCRT